MKNTDSVYLQNTVGNLLDVETISRKFAKYRVITQNGRLCIEGYGGRKLKSPAYLINEPILFFSLIGLIDQHQLPTPSPAKRVPYIASYPKTPSPQRFPAEWLSEAIPMKFIVGWINTYGLPYAEDSLESGGSNIIEVARFRERIAILYSYFILWNAILSGSEIELDSGMLGVGLKPSDYLEISEKMTISKQTLVSLLADRSETRLELIYYQKDDAFRLKLRAESLLDVCFFQLAALITTIPNKEAAKLHMRTCEGCTTLFWGRANRKYCSKCKRSTIWSRRQREVRNG